MKIIGLTGNTGSGKGYVSEILEEVGALVINADKVAHEAILKGKSAYNEIIDFFGMEILGSDKEIDRKKLGAIVFRDREKLDYLSQIVHRYVIDETKKTIERTKSNTELLVIDAPLLIEAGMHKICNEVWLVYASHDTRLKRIMDRDGLSEEEALARMSNQTPFEVLRPYAKVVIYNDEGYNAVPEQVNNVLRSEHKMDI